MASRSTRWPLLLALLLAPACTREPAASAPQLLDPGARLDPPARTRIERYLGFVAERYGVDYRAVVAEPGAVGAPESEGAHWYRELDVGAATQGRGLLLWLDPDRGLARLEVGYALEPLIPDLESARILSGYFAPHARAQQLPASVEAAVEGIVDRLRPVLEELPATAAPPGSGGAGAGVDLARPPAPVPLATEGPDARGLVPQADPRATRDLELALLRAGRYEPGATIYDEAWRRRPPRAAFGPERLRELGRKWSRPYEVEIEGDHAVAWYRDAPALGPTLLRRETAGWVLDASARYRLVVYDYSNELWYFLDEPGPWLDLLRRVYPMERVRLDSGRDAWRVARSEGPTGGAR